MTPRQILVTGAAGYIGSAVCWKLLNRGYRVLALDNLKYGVREAVPPGVPLIECSLLHYELLDDLFMTRQIDVVVHLAAESLIPLSFQAPDLFYRVNVRGGLNLLEVMRLANCRRFVFSSTSSVYAPDGPVPMREDNPLGPSSPYGASKLAFEQSLPWMSAIGLRWVAFRYFNVCGATEHVYERPYHRSRLTPVAMDTARGRLPAPMPLNGTDYATPDGTCVRDYIQVDDIAEAHVLALERLDDGVSGVFNLGIGRGYSNREVIREVERVTGQPVPVQEAGRRPGDPAVLVADATRARTLLNWTPQYTELGAMIESAWRGEP